MRAPILPAATEGQSAWSMRLQATGGELGIYLKSDAYRIAKLPRLCPVQTRLGIWEIEHAIIPILLLRVVPDSSMLFESWVDAVSQAGIATLKALSSNTHLKIYFVAEKVERTMQIENEHLAKAKAIVKKLEHWQRWSTQQVDAATADIRRMFPTTRDIWFAAAKH